MSKQQPNTSQKRSHIEAGKRVLEQEIAGLQALVSTLDEKFDAAVELIYNLKGRLVVSGMGKSGHIARKIAATLASTGTPALFVHPGEASHGDLGMVTSDDAVMLLSNSGETSELTDIIYYCKRFTIPLIGMVRKSSSTLVDAANIAFVLPDTAEASPVGAPTTSTTMMLAWGDALAMALLEMRGFSKQDFHVYHPGGKLGSQFISVDKLMRIGDSLPLVKPSSSMADTLIIMTEKSLGCAAVVDGKGKLQGIVTDGDLRRHMQQSLLAQSAEDVMTRNPITIRPNALAVEALSLMNQRNITSVMVADEDGTLAGLLHIHDILRAGVS